jgi:hypothetical protein
VQLPPATSPPAAAAAGNAEGGRNDAPDPAAPLAPAGRGTPEENQKALGYLFRTVSDQYTDYVVCSTTAEEAWNKLHMAVVPQLEVQAMLLTEKWNRVRVPLVSYVIKLRSELAGAGSGARLAAGPGASRLTLVRSTPTCRMVSAGPRKVMPVPAWTPSSGGWAPSLRPSHLPTLSAADRLGSALCPAAGPSTVYHRGRRPPARPPGVRGPTGLLVSRPDTSVQDVLQPSIQLREAPARQLVRQLPGNRIRKPPLWVASLLSSYLRRPSLCLSTRLIPDSSPNGVTNHQSTRLNNQVMRL